jgi:hypothetical protein
MNVTPEMAAALFQLRKSALTGRMSVKDTAALNLLDNAGVFADIDESTGYDVSSPVMEPDGRDPAEWGDLSYVTVDQAQLAKSFRDETP